ncbi:murein L,D-transpeptidase family protein [Haliscomenobacter sp.]|uniref:L,D-transpeptidase family protein n=1 Tax=Haliscomenobacter sp. TaxID=2717303 RepID=UPI0035936B44
MIKALQTCLYLSMMLGSLQCNSQADTASASTFNGDRVAQARHLVGEQLKQDLVAKGLKPGAPIFLRAFKSEQQLEVWIQDSAEFRHFRTYPICRVPGLLGPKRKEGDLQVPEGLYWIEVFNPKSSYHLSMGINYPNASDRVLSDPKNPGGEIYIHGNCVSVGCLPITDEKIRELYLLASDAKDAGQQQIPVHIFPCRMTPENRKNLLAPHHPELLPFWDNLSEAYDFFERKKILPTYTIEPGTGTYLLTQ